jgi:hypothetical protein
MRSRDRPRPDDLSEGGTLLIVQDRNAPGRFAGCKTIGAFRVERSTQSRTICSVTPATFAASLRLPPSKINAIASRRRT